MLIIIFPQQKSNNELIGEFLIKFYLKILMAGVRDKSFEQPPILKFF